jgi:hypothetical protein
MNGQSSIDLPLAARIEQDIRARGLRHGQAYLTTREVASLFSVSTTTANEALRALADREVLLRKPKVGTLVGPAMDGAPEVSLASLHVFLRGGERGYSLAERSLIDAAMPALYEALGFDTLQTHLLPEYGQESFLEAWREQNSGPPNKNAVLLVLSSASVQRFFADSPFPTMAWGSVWPCANRLPNVDLDQHAVGRSVTDFAIRSGHRRCAYFMRQVWAYGDSLFMDGVQERLAEEDGNACPAVFRSVLDEAHMLEATLHELLAMPEPPTAFVCRNAAIAQIAGKVLDVHRRQLPREPLLISAGPARGAETRFPCIVHGVSFAEQGRIIGRMLSDLCRGARPEPYHVHLASRLMLEAEGEACESVMDGPLQPAEN